MKLSVIIPAYKEPYLQRTIDSVLDNSSLGGDMEVIAVLDGIWLETPLKEDPRVRVVEMDINQGMRAAINTGLSASAAEFVLKLDAHCHVDQGFDKVLVDDCEKNWLMIPRRYSLDDSLWDRMVRKPYRDYHFLRYPDPPPMTVHDYIKFDNGDSIIDDTLTFQGSCWVANREYFMDHVGFLDDRPTTYGRFAGDQLEIGMKYWLNGGEVKVNKKTWYAHLYKMSRHYSSGQYAHKPPDVPEGWLFATRHWMNNEEPGMKKPFEWVIEKFMPLPTWPDDKAKWQL